LISQHSVANFTAFEVRSVDVGGTFAVLSLTSITMFSYIFYLWV